MVGTLGEGEETRARAALPYFPGLDGLRAIAVIAVLFFHAGASGAPGGFLGVSLFFTLSGFLITGLLLDEFATTGRVALRAFWGRRVRRLLPAALVCLGLVLASSYWLVEPNVTSRLRGDVVAAAADVANWRFIWADQSYAELFARQPSAVLHFWSLAIEEQFYIVFPCIAVVLLRRRRAWVLPLGLILMIGASVVASVITASHDVVYYGTHTRAAELLIGGLLAWVVQSRRASQSSPKQRRAPWAPNHATGALLSQLAGFGALLALVVLVVRTRQDEQWLYRGGFAVLAVLWCVLILAARLPGPFSAVAGTRVLAAIGRRSYGLYLYHWPVFALVTPDRLGIHGWPARLIQLMLIAELTEVSHRFVERPIRLRRSLVEPRRARAVALGCIAAVIVTAIAMPTPLAGGGSARIEMADAPDEVVHLLPSSLASGASDPGAASAASIATSSARSRSSGSSAESGSSGVAATATTAIGDASPAATDAPAIAEAAAVPALRVVVAGGVTEVADVVRSFRDDGYAIDVDDRTIAGCSAIAADADTVADGACLAGMGTADESIDVLVIGIGAADHEAIDHALSLASGADGAAVFSLAQLLQSRAVEEFGRLGRRASRVVVVDAVAPAVGAADERVTDLLDEVIDEAVLSTPSLRRTTLAGLQPGDLGATRIDATTTTSLPSTAPSAPAIVVTTAPPAETSATMPVTAPLKVVVIGDSTSYGVAKALAESVIAPLDVVWAGRRNCPMVRLEALRWVTGNEFSMADCPSVASVWPEQIASFRPDVVLVVEGLPEQSEQRYAGDPAWHVAGDPQFVAVHEAEFTSLLELAAGVGAVVVLAAQPHMAADTPAMWATPERVDAWNAQLASWDAQWSAVATMPYGEAVEAAEAAAGHTLRPDGLHLDRASVHEIVGTVLAPALVEQVTMLQAQLRDTGCIVASADGKVLELTRCR